MEKLRVINIYPEKEKLTECLGIEEHIGNNAHQIVHSCSRMHIADTLEEISRRANNPNELAFLCYVFGRLEQRASDMNNNPFAQM